MTAIFVEAALRSLALAAVVGFALSVLRVRNVPARKAAWTLVLLASFAMPLVMRAVPSRFGWALPVRFAPKVPATTATHPPQFAAQTEERPTIVHRAAVSAAAAPVSDTNDGARVSTAPISIDLAPAAPEQTNSVSQHTFRLPGIAVTVIWAYLAVAAFLLVRLGIGLSVALHLWRSADPVSPLIAPEPNVRSSSRIASPVTIGSGIVLPSDYIHWDARKLRMVMAHERSHVRQLDFYLQMLAGLYTALFWFSPLGWWLRRTLSALGEAIGDRAGIDASNSRTGYANLVLEFAALPHKLLPGVAMARSTNLARRVDSMLNENLFRALFSEGRRRAMASLLVIPAALFAVTALVRVPSAAAQSAPQNTQPPQAQTPASGQSNPPETQVTTDAAPAAAPLPPDQAMPAPPPPSSAPAAAPAPGAYATSIGSGKSAGPGASSGEGQSNSVITTDTNTARVTADGSDATAILEDGAALTLHGGHAYVFNDGQSITGNAFHFSSNGDSWAIVNGPGSNYTFSGNWGNGIPAEIENARKMANGPFLWFMHDGKSYIITDPAILARVEKMEAPMHELSKQQAELGKQQEALGRMQEDMAHSRTETITIKMPDLSKEMADLSAQIAQMKVDQYQINAKALADLNARIKDSVGQTLTPEKLAEIQKQIAEVQVQLTPERIAEIQAKLGAMQARLGELQGDAGAKEGAIGERMGELGERQGRLGELQGRLGEEQGRLAEEIERTIRPIIDEALKNGTAKPVQ